MRLSSSLLFLLAHSTWVNVIALVFYRMINAPLVNIPRTIPSTPPQTFSIEKMGTTLYTAVHQATTSNSFVPWEVQEIATKVIAHLPSTTVTLNGPTTRVYTIMQAKYAEMANIPPVAGPLITPTAGPVLTLYEYGFQRYCSMNPSIELSGCEETIVKPRVGMPAPTEPPVEAVGTRHYTGIITAAATVYTSLPSG
ncbi:hypothetical protein BJ165DRAFT_1507651 [Panaeolus papilionaceus]|nr:hypothetical protein BJ165DRAFT_1507651 [Panaeolus papilionaceus]